MKFFNQQTVSFIISATNHIIVECKINNIKGIFIVDTGASSSCLNFKLARKFNIKYEKSKEKAASASSKINETYYSKNNILKIGNCQKIDFELVLFDMTFINNSIKGKDINEVDGIIGSDILNELNACVNYKKKEIFLQF